MALQDRVLDAKFPMDDSDVPPRIDKAAGMLSLPERRLLYHLAEKHYAGKGHIIDAGSFFGSSTVSLAEGLKANTSFGLMSRRFNSSRKPIVSYDIGFLPAPSGARLPITRQIGEHRYTWGDSFVPILNENISGHEDVIELRIGDFLNERWPVSRPIELCFIDLAKTNDLNIHCFRQLFPAFVPGETLLIQQDFFFDRLPWIKVLMGYLSEHFEWLGQVGPSSLYRYKSAIPASMYAIDPFTDLPVLDRIKFHRLALNPSLPPRRRFAIELSLCYLLENALGPEAALEESRAVRERFSDLGEKSASVIRRLDRADAQFTRARSRSAITTSNVPVRDAGAIRRPDFAARAEAKRLVTRTILEVSGQTPLLPHEPQLQALYQEWTTLPTAGNEHAQVRSEFVEARKAAQQKLNAEKRKLHPLPT